MCLYACFQFLTLMLLTLFNSVLLDFFTPATHLGIFLKFAAHLDQSADLDFSP